MATPIPPDITVKLYQLEENGGGTDLQKKSSPAEVTYDTGDLTSDFYPVSISDIKETLEIDKGVYQIDSVSLVVEGLSETFFNSYVNPLTEPYVCEIYDNNDAAVLFHGPIDRTSVTYNPGTGYTSFDVTSWLYVLEQTSAAARYIYDTKMTRRYDGKWDDTYRAVFISKTINGLDMSTVVQSGDVVVFDSGAGEHRIPVLAAVADGTDLVLTLLAAPENLYVSDITVASPVKGRNLQNRRYVKLTVTSSTLYTALQRFHSDSNVPEYIGNKINVFVSPNGGTHSGEVHFFSISDDPKAYDATGRQYWSDNYWKLVEDGGGDTVTISFETTDEDWVTDAVANGVDIDVGGASSIIEAGGKIRILGREVYGYVETAGFDEIGAKMKLQSIIEGLFGLDDLGVMQYVTDTFTYPVGWNPEWDKWLEYPNKLIDSLRMMQDTEYFFFKFTPTLDGSSLPRMTLEVIPRNEANTTDRGAATALTGIIDYSEESADRTPRAVKVKPNKPYLLPKAWDHVDHVGFYFDSMPTTAQTIANSQMPEGADVLEFTANWTPTYADTKLWAANGKSVMNDEVGKNKARRFYEFYENLSRSATFKYNGELGNNMLGEFVSINEGGLTRTIFVTGISRGVLNNLTTVTGLVGEYTETTSSTPVSVIDGDLRYTDTDSGGTEDISLNGARSYDPNGLNLTYEWILDPLGTPSTIGTDVYLNDYTLAVGTHTIRLTVDNGTTTASTDVTIKVIAAPPSTGTGTDPEADFQQSPFLTVDSSGDVFVNAAGNYLTQATSGGVVVDYSLTSSSGPWSSATGTPFTNPVSLGTVYSSLAEDTTIWVRVRLLNDTDGSTSANEWIGQITNVLGATMSTLTVQGPTVVQIDGIGSSITDTTEDLTITNTTAAAAGAQQYSPALRFLGNGWRTNATAESQTVEMRSYLRTVQDAASPYGEFVWESSIDGAAYNELMYLTTTDGQLTLKGRIRMDGTLAAGTYQFFVGGAAGAARDILLAGQFGVTNGFTVQYDGVSRMVYTMALGDLTVGGTVAGAAGSGFGLTPTDGTLHVLTASAGSVTASTSGDELVVEHSGDGGLSILTPAAANSNLYFGSPSNNLGALIRWNHNGALFQIGTNGVGNDIIFRPDAFVDNLRLEGASGSQKSIFYGSLFIAEKAAALADTAGQGQLWVKNTTPCELWFTDDAGTDTKIV